MFSFASLSYNNIDDAGHKAMNVAMQSNFTVLFLDGVNPSPQAALSRNYGLYQREWWFPDRHLSFCNYRRTTSEEIPTGCHSLVITTLLCITGKTRPQLPRYVWFYVMSFLQRRYFAKTLEMM